MNTWVIGARGLLGSAITRQFQQGCFTSTIRWGIPALAHEDIRNSVAQFAQVVNQGSWSIIWAAGSATTSSSPEVTALELESFAVVITEIRNLLPANRGTVFISSSAGGVYAGSSNPPFTYTSPPIALSPYGQLKIDQEHLATEILSEHCRVVIGRISNLYGPGQDLTKLQGLISRLAISAITKQPLSMFVSLDTLRDYIYSDDAARVILELVANTNTPRTTGASQIEVIASGQSTSLGYLINLMQDIARTRIPIAFGAHASSVAQSRDLRLIPTHPAFIERNCTMPLAAGVKAVYLDVLERYSRATTSSNPL